MLRRLSIVALALAGGCLSLSAQTIEVGGSDLLQEAVGVPLSQYVRQNKLDVKIDMYGTLPALGAMRDGKMDLAIVAAPSGQALPIPPGYEKMDFCFQVAYIVVNPDNPITEIDRDDLVGVFGAGEETDISRWEQLGLAGSWSLRAVLPVSSNSNEGVVLELFKYTILGQIQLKPTVMVLNSSADVDKYIGDNPNAIAITRYVPDTEGKALLVSIGNSAASSTPGVGDTGATSVSFEPSPENVYDGDYPLRLPFYVVYKTSEKVQLRELLRVLYSDDFTSSLSDNHFMPVPDTVRKRNLLELDSAK